MFLCDVPRGTIIYFDEIPNYYIKVKRLDGVSGVVNLETGIFYEAKDLREQGVDPDHFSYVAPNFYSFTTNWQ